MTGMAYFVRRDTFDVTTIDLDDSRYPDAKPQPYWSATSADGENRYVAVSGLNQVALISFADEKRLGTVPTGLHAQRVRTGRILSSALGAGATP